MSGLPWQAFAGTAGTDLVAAIAANLAPSGAYTQFTYSWTRWAPPARPAAAPRPPAVLRTRRALAHGVGQPAAGRRVHRDRPSPGGRHPAGGEQMSSWIGDVPASAAPVLIAVLLVAEAGLLIGVAMPGASLVLGLGVLAGAGAVPFSVAALSAAGATVLGATLGHRSAARHGAPALLPEAGLLGRLLTRRVADVAERLSAPWVETVGRRPVRAAATAQFVAGGRTLAPPASLPRPACR